MKMDAQLYHLTDAADIPTPALVCYPDIIARNIERMIDIAGDAQRLWVHVKSFKTPQLVHMLMAAGISRFKCATIAEAEMAASCGARHVLLAYPLIGPSIQRFLRLKAAYPCTAFYGIGDDEHALLSLSQAALEAHTVINLLLDVNTGLNRTGVAVEKLEPVYQSVYAMKGLNLCGLHVYDGQRHEADRTLREALVHQDMRAVYAVQTSLKEQGFACDVIVLGGTPTFPCHAKQSKGYLSPGTCVLHDAGYAQAFADLPFVPGALVLTRVVSHPGAELFTVDLGYKAVAADPAIPRAVLLGYEDAQTVMQNEEHWTLRSPDRPPIGETLYAIPMHICPTVALYAGFLVAREGRTTARWLISARNRSLSI